MLFTRIETSTKSVSYRHLSRENRLKKPGNIRIIFVFRMFQNIFFSHMRTHRKET